ncbi:MAG: helix-turn-helix transcriptional regulator [Atopobiaceae bacterium]|nr:helix-turn-helix transcriptional regulator [Atopobiaceae bacterium]
MGKRLGNLIRQARTNAGLTQASLAAQVVGASQSDIGRFERGEAEPTTQVVKDIAKACGVTQKSLLEAMPKTTTSSSSSSTSSSTGTSMRVSATEKRLVELYRAADSATKKRAMAILKGESSTGSTGGLNVAGLDLASLDAAGLNVEDLISGLGGLLGDTLLKK